MKNFEFISKAEFMLDIIDYLNILYSNNLTQVDIAGYLDVTPRTIRKWEAKESIPSADKYANLKKLCECFN